MLDALNYHQMPNQLIKSYTAIERVEELQRRNTHLKYENEELKKENHKLNVTTDDYENMSEDNNVIKYAYGNRDFQQADLDMLIDDPFQIAF